jgi:hypothetical protein
MAHEHIDVVRAFVAEVEQRAEAMMLKTHKLEGMHYAAMKAVLAEWERMPPNDRKINLE